MYCLWHYVIRIFLICPNKYTVITTTRFEKCPSLQNKQNSISTPFMFSFGIQTNAEYGVFTDALVNICIVMWCY